MNVAWQRWRYGLRHPLARSGLIALAVALVLLIAAVVLWRPVASERAELDEQIARQRRALVAVREARALHEAYVQAAERVPQLETRLRQAVSSAALVGHFGELARRQDVRIVTESYDDSRAEGPWQAVSGELTVEGDYPAIRGFVSAIAGLPTWSVVDELRIASVAGRGALRARLRVVTRSGGAAVSENGT